VRSFLSRIGNWCNRHEALIIFLGMVAVFRVPSLFEPHHYGDEEIYFVMGRSWREGVALYQGVFDHKPPLIYLLAGITGQVFWFRFVLMLWMLVHTVLFYLLAGWFWGLPKGELWTKKRRALFQNISTTIFALLGTLPGLEGNIANGELFMMMPMTAAMVILLRAKNKTPKIYLAAGVIAGLGMLFKIPIIFDFVAIVLFLFGFEKKSFREGIMSFADRRLWYLVIGFLMPYALSIIWYFAKGAGQDYLNASLLVNLGYTSSYATSSYEFNPFASGLFTRGVALGLFTLFLYVFRNRLGRGVVFASLVFSWSFFAALLSGRPYPHYLQQPVIAFSLLVPLVFVMERVVQWLAFGALVGAGVLMQREVGFWYYPTVSYYKNFVNAAYDGLSGEDYIYSFSNSRLNYPVADFLNERLGEGDSIYIWGTDPTIYNLTNTLPTGGKYIVSFHVRDWKAWDEVMDKLTSNKPTYVVVLPDRIEFAEFFAWLEHNYMEIGEIRGAVIYRRM